MNHGSGLTFNVKRKDTKASGTNPGFRLHGWYSR